MLQLRQPICSSGVALPYHLFVPAEIKYDAMLVAVHGVDTRAEQLLSLLVTKAARRGIAILAPDFSATAYKGYQTLAGADGSMRSAEALCAAVASAQDRLGMVGEFDLMGFSGGAQFAHRFAMFYPELIRHLIAVAAGWYTYLDSSAAFPYGIGPSRRDGGLRTVDAERFLAIPKLIAVGDMDTERDDKLRQTQRVDRAGTNRLERAQRWHAHLSALRPGSANFALLPDTPHSVTYAMRKGHLRNQIFNFIADKQRAKQTG